MKNIRTIEDLLELFGIKSKKINKKVKHIKIANKDGRAIIKGFVEQ